MEEARRYLQPYRSVQSADRRSSGFALVSVLLLALVLLGLLWAMFTLTRFELTSARTSADITSGFFAAEAGLNIRGEQIRTRFEGYRRPSGTSPLDGDCSSSAGTGDFACDTETINDRTVTTYVVEDPRNNALSDAERYVTIPTGELFAGLNAIQYRYSVLAEAVPPHDDRPEALLEMIFRTRLVPMFQFAAFYDKDLEILPGANMTLDGRVHTNGDLYLNSESSNTLRITGQVSAAVREDGSGGRIHRGRKDRQTCQGSVSLPDGSAGGRIIPCQGSSFVALPDSTFNDFNGLVRTRVDRLTVPEPEEFDIGGMYWQEADVRIALDLTDGLANARPVVLRSGLVHGEPVVEPVLTNTLHTCLAVDAHRVYDDGRSGGGRGNRGPEMRRYEDTFGDALVRAVEYSSSFQHRREHRQDQMMLEVDVQGLLNCLHQNESSFFADRAVPHRTIATERNGGLVWYLTVLGPDAAASSSAYGVRLRNGATLAATAGGAPEINGLTVVSDQAAFIQGDYNRSDWKPAAFIADTVNILSNAWDDDRDSHIGLGNRIAQNTTVNAAFLSGTDVTGDAEGHDGQNGAYNGGLENYPRFHENWSGKTFTYRGSFVSLGEPRHANGRWGQGDIYSAPNRDWDYDVRFNHAQNLPPLSPRFVYLVQERFIRDFER